MVRMVSESDADLLRKHAAIKQEMRRRGLRGSSATTTAGAEDTESSSDGSSTAYTPDDSDRASSSPASSVRSTPAGSFNNSASASDLMENPSIQRGLLYPQARSFNTVGSRVATHVEAYTKHHGIVNSWINKETFDLMPLEFYQKTGNLEGLVARAKAVAARSPQSIPAKVVTALQHDLSIRQFVPGQYKLLTAPPGSVLDEDNKKHEAIQAVLEDCLRILTAARTRV